MRNDGGGGDLHQHDVVEPDAVEAVLQGNHALDFVRLDHASQDVMHRGRLPARGDRVSREPVRGGENAAEVIGWMAPLGGKPGVVEVEPADHRADVECRLDRIELELRAGHLRSVRHGRAGHDRSEQLRARRIRERFESAAQRVDQAVARRLVRFLAFYPVMGDIVGDIDEHLVRLGAHVRDRG